MGLRGWWIDLRKLDVKLEEEELYVNIDTDVKYYNWGKETLTPKLEKWNKGYTDRSIKRDLLQEGGVEDDLMSFLFQLCVRLEGPMNMEILISPRKLEMQNWS